MDPRFEQRVRPIAAELRRCHATVLRSWPASLWTYRPAPSRMPGRRNRKRQTSSRGVARSWQRRATMSSATMRTITRRGTLVEFVAILAPAAVFANSDWMPTSATGISSTSARTPPTALRPSSGRWETAITRYPVYVSAKFLGEYFDDQPGMALLGEFGDRTTRALLVGGRPLLAVQYLTGGGRPSDHWRTNRTGGRFAAPTAPAAMPSWARCPFSPWPA